MNVVGGFGHTSWIVFVLGLLSMLSQRFELMVSSSACRSLPLRDDQSWAISMHQHPAIFKMSKVYRSVERPAFLHDNTTICDMIFTKFPLLTLLLCPTGIEKPPNQAVIASLNKLLDQAWLTTKPTNVRYLITLDMRHHMFKGNFIINWLHCNRLWLCQNKTVLLRQVLKEQSVYGQFFSVFCKVYFLWKYLP